MGLLKKAFYNETKHFYKLSKQGQQFLVSVFLYNIINPIYAIFIYSFLWRQTQDIMLVAMFNIGWFSLLPVGFYCNGQLLKRYSIKKLYFAGAIGRALLIAYMVFFPSKEALDIVLLGMACGVVSGMFFANKNMLSMRLTTSSNRIYFSSLDFITQTISNILVPAAVGVFIVFGNHHAIYTTTQGYQIVTVMLILFSIFLGSSMKRIQIQTPDISKIIYKNASYMWNCARGITAFLGIMGGLYSFLPIVIVMHFLGKEDTLGVVQSVAAVISGTVLYSVARSVGTKYRLHIIAVSLVAILLGTIALAFFFSKFAIFFFVAMMTFSLQLLQTMTNSVIFDLADRDSQDKDHFFKYVFDLEFVLNFGRVTGLMFFFLYIRLFSTEFAIRYTPFLLAIGMISIFFLARIIEANKDAQAETETELAESYAHES